MTYKKKAAKKLTNTLPSEHEEQVGIVNWIRRKFPEVVVFAIPNGDKRSISVAKRLKAEGVVAGVPDLFIPDWNLWIEMKKQKGGRLSAAQKDMIEHLERIGHTVIVGYGATDASQKITDFLKAT